MAGSTEHDGQRRWSRWRMVAWGGAAFLLLLPLVAMQFTNEVNWNLADFGFAAALLAGVGIPLELVVRKTRNAAYRAGAAVALGAALLLVWVNGAVGIIGSENNDANLMYGGVLAIGVVGAFIARFRPRGMARAMFAAALAQATVAAIAIIGGLGYPSSGPLELVAINAFFVALFVGSAMLFQEAARATSERGPA